MATKKTKTSKNTKTANKGFASYFSQSRAAIFVLVFAAVGSVILASTFAASPKTTGTISIAATNSTDGQIHWGSALKVSWTMSSLPKSKYVYLGIVCPEIEPTNMTRLNGGADWNASYYPGNQPSPWNTVMGWDASHSSQLNSNGTASYYYYSNYTPAVVATKTDTCSVGLLVGGSGPSTLIAKKLFTVVP